MTIVNIVVWSCDSTSQDIKLFAKAEMTEMIILSKIIHFDIPEMYFHEILY